MKYEVSIRKQIEGSSLLTIGVASWAINSDLSEDEFTAKIAEFLIKLPTEGT